MGIVAERPLPDFEVVTSPEVSVQLLEDLTCQPLLDDPEETQQELHSSMVDDGDDSFVHLVFLGSIVHFAGYAKPKLV